MSNNINDIFPGGADNNNADKEKLLNDLNNDIHFGEDAFENDAAEGLQQLPNSNVSQIVDNLNLDLHKHISKKKRKVRGLPDQSAVYVSIVIILILMVVAYIILRKVLS